MRNDAFYAILPVPDNPNDSHIKSFYCIIAYSVNSRIGIPAFSFAFLLCRKFTSFHTHVIFISLHILKSNVELATTIP